MRLYLIESEGSIGWDEYVGFVVRAKNRKEAAALVADKYKSTRQTFTIRALSPRGKPDIVLESFNAG